MHYGLCENGGFCAKVNFSVNFITLLKNIYSISDSFYCLVIFIISLTESMSVYANGRIHIPDQLR